MNYRVAGGCLLGLILCIYSEFSDRCLAGSANTNDIEAMVQEDAQKLPSELEIPLWDKSVNLRPAVGYKDNVLLNDADRKNSGFFDTGVDVTILRLPLDDWEYRFVVTGDDYRYWRNQGVNHEDTWLAESELKRTFGDGWEAGLTFLYTYLDQVEDLFTLTDTIHQPPAMVEGNGFTLRPSLQKDFGHNYWLRLEFEGTRQFLSEPADSFTRFGPRLTLGHAYGRRSEVTLSYALWDYRYDHQVDADTFGAPIPNTTLWAIKQQIGLDSKHYWDTRRRWQTAVGLSYAWYRDNGSGYYNYYEYGASGRLRYAAKTWSVQGLAGVIYTSFPHQPVDFINTPNYRQTLLTFTVRIEKRLTKALNIFANYENNTSLSDSASNVYHANTWLSGVDWEF